jgi:hypothetical protein
MKKGLQVFSVKSGVSDIQIQSRARLVSDAVGSIPAVVLSHPTMPLFVGANASGKVAVYR